MITRIAVGGYRSLRDVRIALGALNVITGANGSGKSSLYRALRLLAAIAHGRIIQSLAAEDSGPRQWLRATQRAERAHPRRQRRMAPGADRPATVRQHDDPLRRPREAPELLLLRERMRDWRFYDHLRTEAPARRPQIGTYTPILASDGADLAAAVETIREIGSADTLDAAVADAFPDATIEIVNAGGFFELQMRQHGLLRPLKSAELSDGTLRYLLLAAALLSPRPPALMILNEPETSLHPDLLPALARLIIAAATHTQIVVVTHAAALISALASATDATQIVLEKELGETVVRGDQRPAWTWPSR